MTADQRDQQCYIFWQQLDEALLQIASNTKLEVIRYLAIHGEPAPLFRETLYAYIAANRGKIEKEG